MSATNTTTNYGLPIFIETDKPAWLVDFNGAMRTIDTQLKTNADAIATKSPILTFNDTAEIDFTKTGDIITANLQPEVSNKVGRALITPLTPPTSDQLVAVDSNGVQEGLGIGTGLVVSNGNLNAIDLNLTGSNVNLSNVVVETTGMTLATSPGNLGVAFNTDKSIMKIYGRLRVTSTLSSNTAVILRLPISANPTGLSEDIAISPAGLSQVTSVTAGGATSTPTVIRISPDGTIRLAASIFSRQTMDLYFFPCIYFIKDFGDVE